MNKKLEITIKELYALDPSLKQHEDNLYNIVTTLVDTMPDINIDENFVKKLRLELLTKSELSISSPENDLQSRHKKEFFGWVLPLIPIGVAALLMLIFIPQFSNLKPNNGPNIAQNISGNSLNIASQKPSNNVIVDFVDLEKNSFIAIHEDANNSIGTILGASSMLSPGRTENINIALLKNTTNGEVLYAAIYADNGDGLFDINKDNPVLDPIIGVPMYMVFTISSDANSENISQ